MEAEFAGVKFSGGRLFIFLTALSTLAGGAWTAFEGIKRYQEMEAKIAGFVSPDLSHIDNHMTMVEGALVVVETEFEALKAEDQLMNELIREQVNSMKEVIGRVQTDIHDLNSDMRTSISDVNNRLDKALTKQSSNLDKQEQRNRQNIEDVRTVIASFETRMDSKVDRLDSTIDNLESKLKDLIQKALTNPLNN